MARKKKRKKKEDMVKVVLKHRITINRTPYHGTVIVPLKIARTLRRLDSNANQQNRSR